MTTRSSSPCKYRVTNTNTQTPDRRSKILRSPPPRVECMQNASFSPHGPASSPMSIHANVWELPSPVVGVESHQIFVLIIIEVSCDNTLSTPTAWPGRRNMPRAACVRNGETHQEPWHSVLTFLSQEKSKPVMPRDLKP